MNDPRHVGLLLAALDGNPSSLQHDLQKAGWVARTVRGSRMGDWERLFDEFAAAFQLPRDVGMNGNGLVDAMTDLDEAITSSGVAIIISEADAVLTGDGDPELARAGFLDLLAAIAERYAEPEQRGNWWDRPALPLAVVLHEGDGLWPDVSRRRIDGLPALVAALGDSSRG